MNFSNIAIQLKSKFKTNGKAMDYLKNLLIKMVKEENIEEKEVYSLLIHVKKELEICKEEPCMIINGKLFDWKEMENIQMLIEFLNLIKAYLTKEHFEIFIKRIIKEGEYLRRC